MPPRTEELERAEQAMKARRFGEAIAAFEAHLDRQPDDLRALLRLGICHLLDRSEAAFVAIHARAGALIAGLSDVPDDLARLWRQVQELARRTTATALVLGAATLPACEQQSRTEAQRPQPAAMVDAAAPGKAAAVDAEVPRPEPVAVPAVDAAAPDAAAAAAPAAPEPQDVRPAHRYSGGVRPAPEPEPDLQDVRPAHRYSGGVRPAPEPELQDVRPRHRYSGGVRMRADDLDRE